ncbi:hypothetical protein ACFQ8W_26265 [Streptomyces sp. NPDC056508]|uniref:hypothetical protein n=1 Tax=Streptomyces sp. NPDC056508 TaxID=3345845 RepID=UPI0036919D4B
MTRHNSEDDGVPSEEYVFYDEEGEPCTQDPYSYETENEAAGAYEPLTDDAEPDVFLDVPLLKVDEIDLDVENLRAHVSLQAEVLDLLKLNVGADVVLGRVHLGISGVEAQAQLRVRLDNVARIINRVLTTLDRNPEMLYELARGVRSAVQDVGGGARYAVGEVGRGTGAAVQDVGRGAGAAVRDVSQDAGAVVRGLGGDVNTALHEVGHGVGAMAEDVGGGAEGAVRDVGGEASRTAARTGKKVSGTVEGAARKAPGVTKTTKAKTTKAKTTKDAADAASSTARRAKSAARSATRKTATEKQEGVTARSQGGTRTRRARAEDGKPSPRPTRRTPEGRREPP